ncbi:hypothetical protein ACFLS0_03495 [Candidatus Bipolaricaulota bacterium]
MKVLVSAALILLLITVPVVAEQSALTIAVEFCTGTLAAAVPFYAVLFRSSEAFHSLEAPQFAKPATENTLLGLALPPLVAGATVACVGRLFGVTGKLTGLASILGASIGELFALRAWELNLPEWLKVIAVPALTSLGATLAFNRLARSSP